MTTEAIKEFDGYEDIIKEIEISRKYGTDYTLDKDSADRYIARLHPPRLSLRVADIIEETASAKTLRLVSTDGYLPPFQAGQYIALYVEKGGIRTSRPYSISSPPNQTGYYELTVRRVEGGLVSGYLLDEVKRGEILESSGPAGHFYYNPLFHDKTMVCLAGGSGITPFASMIRQVVECGLDRTVYLFYGNKDLGDVIFHEFLETVSMRFVNIHYHQVIEDPPDGYGGLTGLMTGDLLKETLGDLRAKTFYICGPQAMYDFCLPELERMGVPAVKVRKEVYGAPLDITGHPGWPEEIKAETVFKVRVKDGGSFEARAGEPLMAAIERNGLRLPSICRSGECSMCRIKVLSGKVFQPAGALVRKSDRLYGYVHSCVSYPLDDLEILL